MLKTKKALKRALFHEVELAGVEPASKQGTTKLSTCLFCS